MSKKMNKATIWLAALVLIGSLLVAGPLSTSTTVMYASTGEGNLGSEGDSNNEDNTEESGGGDESRSGESNEEQTPEESETEPVPPVVPEEPIVPVEPAITEKEVKELECPENFVLNEQGDKCVPDSLAELEELVGPPPECPPELGLTPLECLDKVVNPPAEPPVAETEEEIDPCLLDPGHESCPEPDPITGECPPGYNMNADEQCYPEHEQCPSGYHSHEDDESGRCIPDTTPCNDGYIMNPDFPSCDLKDRVCEEHPNINECKNGDDDDDDNNDDNDVDIKIINKVVNTVKNVNDRGRENFPEIDIIGLSTKQNGDSMVCLINIDNEHVQCQEFGMASDRVNGDFWRVIETDQDKDYDNGNTGSNDIDRVIDDIKSQDFSELDDATNHDFDIDLFWVAINPVGDGVACLAEDSTGKGKSLCEPFKVSSQEINGQITEGVAIENT